MGAYLNVIACTSVGIWITFVTEGRRVAAARVILHTAHATGRRRTPSSFLQPLLDTSKDRRRCTARKAVVVSLAAASALTITFAQTASCASIRLRITVAVYA
jgi:hypothetical protein